MKLYGKNAVVERLRSNPKSIRKIYIQHGFKGTLYIHKKARQWGIPILPIPQSKMMKIGRDENAQGILIDVEEFAYIPIEDLLDTALDKKRCPVFIDGVKDPQNLRLLSIWNIAGLTLFVVGLTIAFVAVFTLRRFYLSTPVTVEDHRLITHGIYRFARHPIYFGVLIAIMGVPVYAPSLYGFLVLILLIPIFLNRIRMEEEMLTEEFGDAHRMYMETTRKLIPFIY